MPLQTLDSKKAEILLVDDDHSVRELLVDVLESRKFAVACCTDAIEARAKRKTKRFDLIITDFGLPGIGGLEFAARVKQVDVHIPIILVTGLGMELQDEETGIVDFILPKPFNLSSLLELAETALRMNH